MKRLFILLLGLILVISFASCDLISDKLDDGGNSTPEEKYMTVTEAYNEARSLGYQGDLLEFMSLINDSVSADSQSVKIESVSLDEDGRLMVKTSSGIVIDGAEVTTPDDKDDEGLETTFYVSFVTLCEANIEEITVTNGEKIPAISDISRDGYELLGWYFNGTQWNFEDDVVKSNMTLTAKWKAIEYTITYDLAGGTNHPNNPTTYTVEDLPLTLYLPSHPDSSFRGWFSNRGMTEKCTEITEAGNITLYACWGNTPWETTTLIFEISENSNNQVLTSTSRRYLAGDMSTTVGEDKHAVDTLVAARNARAYAATNVKVTYAYLPDSSIYGWGQNFDRINEQVCAQAAVSPDIYSNFVYDMVATSLKSSFASLLSTTMYPDGHALAGAEYNYFAFEDEIDMEDDGEEYMIEYMRSLSLSKYKMYLLASDYCIDLIRAFYVIPVNIELLEQITVDTVNDGKYNSDRAIASTGMAGRDGSFTIEDFYQLIYDGDWTYETLAAYSQAVYSDTGNERKDLGDCLGFAVSTSSALSASGMLYSTSATIIQRELDFSKGNYTYYYPGTKLAADGRYQMSINGRSDELENLCDAISTLFKSQGVLAVSDIEAGNSVGTANALVAIRSEFAKGNILFGGIVCLGSLEYDEYKELNESGIGYGIAPVPLYRGEYNTQIHNIGSICGISYTTKKFAQCTAFLNYQCTSSYEILTTYFMYKHQSQVNDSLTGPNVEMLKYIRSNVRSGFDKAYEDALGIFYSDSTLDESQKQIWHYIIKDSGYTVNGEAMRGYYASYAPIKAQRLYDLEYTIFPSLPH